MTDFHFGFIGFGLIGGSVAKACKTKYTKALITAYDTNLSALLKAQEEGVVDVVCMKPDSSFLACNYIFLCAPVGENAGLLTTLSKWISEDCILTDVGSVKENIMEAIDACGLSQYFIGGHPMAGSEKSGYSNSNARILENAYYILTPNVAVSKERIGRMQALISSLGAIPVLIDARTHDYATAAISHLPHIIAASLVDFVREHDTDDELMRKLAAGGFKDITRIAASSPAMWRDICLTNSAQICTLLEGYITDLSSIRKLILDGDASALYDFFERSGEYRASMPDTSLGLIKKAHVLYLDIPDETGVIARIATLLAAGRINIRNIGIIHNREFEEGALRIEFYNAAALHAAGLLLRKEDYIVFERD